MTNYVKSYKINPDGSVAPEVITPFAAPSTQTITDTEVTIEELPINKVITCVNPITSLTIESFEESEFGLETLIYFTTDDTIEVSMPQDTQWSPFQPVIKPNTSYVMCVENKVVVLGQTQLGE